MHSLTAGSPYNGLAQQMRDQHHHEGCQQGKLKDILDNRSHKSITEKGETQPRSATNIDDFAQHCRAFSPLAQPPRKEKQEHDGAQESEIQHKGNERVLSPQWRVDEIAIIRRLNHQLKFVGQYGSRNKINEVRQQISWKTDPNQTIIPKKCH